MGEAHNGGGPQPRYRVSVPSMVVEHVEQTSFFTPEGIKGAGEGGTIGAIPTCVAAVEDALAPFGVHLTSLPVWPKDLVQMGAARAG